MKKLTNLEKYERAYIKALVMPDADHKSRVRGEEIASTKEIIHLSNLMEDPKHFYELNGDEKLAKKKKKGKRPSSTP